MCIFRYSCIYLFTYVSISPSISVIYLLIDFLFSHIFPTFFSADFLPKTLGPRAELRRLEPSEAVAARLSHICAAADFLSVDYQGEVNFSRERGGGEGRCCFTSFFNFSELDFLEMLFLLSKRKLMSHMLLVFWCV